MGTYNTVKIKATCPMCHNCVNIAIQFKYGNTWQFEYCISDQLRWGENDIGSPGKSLVVIDGVSETSCPLCGYDEEWNFYIFVENNHISHIEEADGKYDYSPEVKSYIVLIE